MYYIMMRSLRPASGRVGEHTRVILLAWLMPLASLQAAMAVTPSIAPPTILARPAVADVERGGSGEMLLTAVPSYGNDISFRIDRMPVNGSLGEIRRIAPNIASVTYTNLGSKDTSDEFFFRIRAPGKCWTTYAATIRVIDPPDSLQAIPTTLDFGAVGLGESVSRQLVLRNRAAGMISGNLFIPPPWRLVGDPSYSIAMGKSVEFKLLYEPHEVTQSSASVGLLSSDATPRIMLKGSGVLPFVLSTNSLLLAPGTGDVELSIENRLAHRIIVKTMTDELVADIPPIVLNSGENRCVCVRVRKDQVSETNAMVRFSYGGYEAGLMLRVPATPIVCASSPTKTKHHALSSMEDRPDRPRAEKVTAVNLPDSQVTSSNNRVDSPESEIPTGPVLLPEAEQVSMRRLMVRDIAYFLKPGWIGWRVILQWRYADPPPKEFLIGERIVLPNVKDGEGGDSVSFKDRRIMPRWVKPLGNGLWQAGIPSPEEGFRCIRIAPVLEGKEKTIWATFQIQMPSSKLVLDRYRGPVALLLLIVLVIMILRIIRS